MDFVETIRAAIARHDLIPAGTKVVVGVSGGADSVALARAFDRLEIPFTAAHLNHNLRGTESDADEAFVRGLGFPTVVKSVEVKALAAETGESLEMAARRARHEFFAEFDGAVIALAHHADDQVETFLLKLARGAGPDGLSGMRFLRRVGPLRLVRPMLDIPRAEIFAWLRANHFDWREDASNADETFLRNKVRHTILPLLEKKLNPNIRGAILRTMNILRAENSALGKKRRALREWLFEHGAAEAGFDAVESILELMESGEGSKTFELNERQRVIVEYGKPRFEENGPQPAAAFKMSVEPGTGWRTDPGRGAGELPAEASFAADQVGDSPIEVRTWRPGDRIAPLGMEGSRKLQDVFTDQKIPAADRARIPVVTCRGEIIWVPGYRIARGWEVADRGAKSTHVLVQRNRAEGR